MTDPIQHFQQSPRRKAEFIRPPNTLKAKVGSGGLNEVILAKAQALLENNSVDFLPLAEIYLASLLNGIHDARKEVLITDPEPLIAKIIYPAMQLKANGGMFHYPLVTKTADKLIQFLEVIENPDEDALDIVLAFHSTIRAITMGKITGDGGKYGVELMDALNEACLRYFDKHPHQRKDTDFDYIHKGDDRTP